MNAVSIVVPVLVGAFALVAASGAALAWHTWRSAKAVERSHPPIGAFAATRTPAGPRNVHYVDRPGNPALLPVVFVHGASGNLRDQLEAFGDALAALPDASRPRAIFLDRPGAGYTQRQPGDHDPYAQARTVAELLDALGIARAVVCGHSYGAGVAATFAVAHPERAAGIALLAPASHPWAGRLVWYYRLVASRALRHVAAWTIVLPLGRRMVQAGVDGTFAPDAATPDYAHRTAVNLLLRPATFLANAADINHIKAHAAELSPRYGEIACPTYICAGEADRVVRATIHAVGLYRAIPQSHMDWAEGVGHKPDYVLTRRILGEILRMCAPPLRVVARGAESRDTEGWGALGEVRATREEFRDAAE